MNLTTEKLNVTAPKTYLTTPKIKLTAPNMTVTTSRKARYSFFVVRGVQLFALRYAINNPKLLIILLVIPA